MAVKRVFGTLRSRIFAALFAISLVPIAVLGAQGYHCAMEAVYELANKHVLAVAAGRSTAVASWIAEREKNLESLATLPPLAHLLREGTDGEEAVRATLQDTLDAFLRVNPSFGEAVLLDAQGMVVANQTPDGHQHKGLADEGLRASAESTGQVVHGLAHGHVAGNVGIHMLCAIKTPDGVTAGLLAAYLDLTKRLTPVLQDRQGLYESGKAYIVSAEDAILTEPFSGATVVLTKYQPLVEAAEHVHGSATDVKAYQDYRGNVVLGAAIPIGFEGWRLVTEINRAEALFWLRVLLARMLATGAVTAIVVVVIAFWLSAVVGRPFRQLVGISHRIRGGHVGARLEEMDVAEAEEVRKAFNAMLDELRLKQEALVRSTTLAYVGELTSSTVHEMRNPLSSIKMNLQAVARSADQDGANKELVEIALQQSMRLERMLTDLLGFGKSMDLDVQSSSFEELADAVRDVMGSAARQQGANLNFENGIAQRPLFVDKEQMCRVLTNLVGNALEALPGPGDIVLRARPCSDPEPGVELSVLDSGPGLSQEALQRSFQPFYTTKTDGTGLGLPNVKKIVELHGGTIAVENRSEGGAAFRIYLSDRCMKET